MRKFQVVKLYPDSMLPTQANPGDAGWDLYSHDDCVIRPRETIKIGTGVALALPAGTFGAIYARSGLATKDGLRPANCVGICDCEYRGEYIVPLHNDSYFERYVHKGDRIAQLVVQDYIPCEMEEVEELNDTERGSGGFGSSGN